MSAHKSKEVISVLDFCAIQMLVLLGEVLPIATYFSQRGLSARRLSHSCSLLKQFGGFGSRI